jgi:transcriptional regulator with XRE-family HTH domain
MSTQEYGKIISKNLKELAYKHGKTQAEIAKDLKLNKATVSSWMNGTRIPRMDSIDLLAHYFNCKRSDIMEEHDDRPEGYYLDEETAQEAQKLFEKPGFRVLFDAARNAKSEDMMMVADILKRLQETNPDG